jgi:hypothetical protein
VQGAAHTAFGLEAGRQFNADRPKNGFERRSAGERAFELAHDPFDDGELMGNDPAVVASLGQAVEQVAVFAELHEDGTQRQPGDAAQGAQSQAQQPLAGPVVDGEEIDRQWGEKVRLGSGWDGQHLL